MYNKIRKLIRSKRDDLHLTQEQVALKLNYKSKSSYNMIENGPTEITVMQFKELIKILHITPKEVIKIFFD